MSRVKRAVARAQYAAIGAAVGAGVGGLISRSAASTGGATGALVGALVGEFRARTAEDGGVTDRPQSDEESGAEPETDDDDQSRLPGGIVGRLPDRG